MAKATLMVHIAPHQWLFSTLVIHLTILECCSYAFMFPSYSFYAILKVCACSDMVDREVLKLGKFGGAASSLGSAGHVSCRMMNDTTQTLCDPYSPIQDIHAEGFPCISCIISSLFWKYIENVRGGGESIAAQPTDYLYS